MRFTLVRMFVAVAFVAVGSAALVYRTPGWTSVIVSATIGLFAIVGLRSLGQQAERRAFGLGFALVGFAYLALATSSFFSDLRPSLCTNYPLALAARSLASSDPSLHAYVPGGGWSPAMAPIPPPPITAVRPTANAYLRRIQLGSSSADTTPLDEIVMAATSSGSSLPLGRFFLIGHCLWSWVFALLGGWFAARMIARRRGMAG